MKLAAAYAWMSVIGVAAAMILSGCGSSSNKDAPASMSATVRPDAEAAYKQLKAIKVLACSTAYDDLSDANAKQDERAVRDTAGKYRDLLVQWEEQVAKVPFPQDVQATVAQIRDDTDNEIRYLDYMTGTFEGRDRDALVRHVYYYEDASLVQIDKLIAALGHPMAPPVVAADRLASARSRYLMESAWVNRMFDSALSHKDLDAAKTANRIEEDALQRFADSLDGIDWPAESVALINELRYRIKEAIAFDRRQVEVVDTTQISVPRPDAPVPEFDSMEKAYTAASKGLYGMDTSASSKPEC
jgi:hypothetical protein